jgi:hypothetical protein
VKVLICDFSPSFLHQADIISLQNEAHWGCSDQPIAPDANSRYRTTKSRFGVPTPEPSRQRISEIPASAVTIDGNG